MAVGNPPRPERRRHRTRLQYAKRSEDGALDRLVRRDKCTSAMDSHTRTTDFAGEAFPVPVPVPASVHFWTTARVDQWLVREDVHFGPTRSRRTQTDLVVQNAGPVASPDLRRARIFL